MKYLLLFLLTFSALSVDAAVWSPSIDTLPKWEVFKKMTKSELLDMAKGDAAALKIVEGEKKLPYIIGGVASAVLAAFAFIGANYFGSLESIEMDSLLNMLMTILLVATAIGLVIGAIFLIIVAFGPSRKKQYRQLNELLKTRGGKE